MYTVYKVSTPPPLGTRLICQAQEGVGKEGRGRESAVQGGSEGGRTRLVSSEEGPRCYPHRKLVCLGSLAPIKMPEVRVPGAFICMLDPTMVGKLRFRRMPPLS